MVDRQDLPEAAHNPLPGCIPIKTPQVPGAQGFPSRANLTVNLAEGTALVSPGRP